MKIALIKTVDNTLIPHSKEDLEVLEKLQDGAIFEVDIKNMDMRTLTQNRAMHKYFSLLSEEFNKGGLTVSKLLKVTVSWTPAAVKELLWKPIQKAVLNKKSTAKLNKDEVIKVYDTLNLTLSERYGISVLFPNKDNLK